MIEMIPLGEDLLVLDDIEGWAKVDVEGGASWVSKEYVSIHGEFVQAESREEEAARLAKEAVEARKAAQAAQNSGDYSVGEGSEMDIAVAEFALWFVGNPYVYGDSSLTKGADFSDFVMSVYANFGVKLPHSSGLDRNQGYAVVSYEDTWPGDLICYSVHVAPYIGNEQIVHASNSRGGIIVSQVGYRDMLAIRRMF